MRHATKGEIMLNAYIDARRIMAELDDDEPATMPDASQFPLDEMGDHETTQPDNDGPVTLRAVSMVPGRDTREMADPLDAVLPI